MQRWSWRVEGTEHWIRIVVLYELIIPAADHIYLKNALPFAVRMHVPNHLGRLRAQMEHLVGLPVKPRHQGVAIFTMAQVLMIGLLSVAFFT